MTSIERAKAFLSDKVKKTALVILPLAAATLSAHAGTITPTFSLDSGSSFNASGAAIPSSSSVGAFTFPGGISLFGSSIFTVTSSGFGTGSSCGNICTGFYAFGSGAGVFPSDTLPVTYDFNATASNEDLMVWDVYACIESTNGESCNDVGGVTSGGEVTGSFDISGLNGATLQSWFAGLQVDFASGWGYTSNDTITVDVPGVTSVDLGPASVPEPATGWMLATAGGVWALLRRRYRRR